MVWVKEIYIESNLKIYNFIKNNKVSYVFK